MTAPTNKPEHGLSKALQQLCEPEGFRVSENATNNLFHWYRLKTPDALLEAAELLARHDARLCTITAYDPKREHGRPSHEIAYHFDWLGMVVTVTVVLAEDNLSVPSISFLFPNADWNEREFREMWGIDVVGLKNTKRLFLDESLDAGILNRVIPVSVLMNGASSKDLWERILAAKASEENAS